MKELFLKNACKVFIALSIGIRAEVPRVSADQFMQADSLRATALLMHNKKLLSTIPNIKPLLLHTYLVNRFLRYIENGAIDFGYVPGGSEIPNIKKYQLGSHLIGPIRFEGTYEPLPARDQALVDSLLNTGLMGIFLKVIPLEKLGGVLPPVARDLAEYFAITEEYLLLAHEELFFGSRSMSREQLFIRYIELFDRSVNVLNAVDPTHWKSFGRDPGVIHEIIMFFGFDPKAKKFSDDMARKILKELRFEELKALYEQLKVPESQRAKNCGELEAFYKKNKTSENAFQLNSYCAIPEILIQGVARPRNPEIKNQIVTLETLCRDSLERYIDGQNIIIAGEIKRDPEKEKTLTALDKKAILEAYAKMYSEKVVKGEVAKKFKIAKKLRQQVDSVRDGCFKLISEDFAQKIFPRTTMWLLIGTGVGVQKLFIEFKRELEKKAPSKYRALMLYFILLTHKDIEKPAHKILLMRAHDLLLKKYPELERDLKTFGSFIIQYSKLEDDVIVLAGALSELAR